jgi:hypothetical protein
MTTNRVVKLERRPVGMAARADFSFSDVPIPEPADGEFRVAIAYVSLDPAMRGWMAEGKSYVAPVGLGEVMRAYAVGIVEASRHDGFAVGEAVVGLFGVQRYANSNGRGVVKADPSLAPLEAWVGGLGMPGWTAYFGLLHVGEAKAGDTVVVSAASGAVGSVVGQIAKIKGCRTVGIAGGAAKCAYIVDELGFDAAIDYRNENLHEALKATCPDGVDVYFENVGGDITDAVLSRMNTFGRVPVCGLISYYNVTTAPVGLKNVRAILVNRLKVQGFIMFDFIKSLPEAKTALAEWYGQGRIKLRQDVREGGVDAYPEVLNELYTGGNFGKLVLKV